MADLAAARPAGQMAAEGDVGHHAAAAARGLLSRSRSAWRPVRAPAGVPPPAAVTGRAGGLTEPGAVRY